MIKNTSIIIGIVLYFSLTSLSQENILVNGHSHNDYKQNKPLQTALFYKFRSIEADVFLINNRLIVSHVFPLFKKRLTLQELYLKPLFDSIQKNGFLYAGYSKSIVLMIDFKSDAHATYTALKHVLEDYKSILTSVQEGKVIERNVTIVITGNKPYKDVLEDSSRFMFIDENLMNVIDSKYDSTVCYMASTKYANVLAWKGNGKINKTEQELLKSLVKAAHDKGKVVRLWAMPENEKVWEELLNCELDLINTDNLKKLFEFLNKKI